LFIFNEIVKMLKDDFVYCYFPICWYKNYVSS